MPILGSPQNSSFYSASLSSGIPFPAGTIVPVWSGYVATPGWQTYFNSNNAAIIGTIPTGGAGAVESTGAGQLARYSGTLGTSGAHSSTTSAGRGTSVVSSAQFSQLSGTHGGHQHTFNATSYPLSITSANVGLIRASQTVYELPPNTIAFRNTVLGAYGTRFNPTNSSASNIVHLKYTSTVGDQGTMTAGVTSASHSSTIISSLSGAHTHVAQNRASTTGTSGAGSRAVIGNHTHDVNTTLSQFYAGPARVLHPWISSLPRVAETDVVVMYNGSPSSLPPGWVICDGTNGTPNMNGAYLVYDSNSTQTAWGTLLPASCTVVSANHAVYSSSHTHVTTPNSSASVSTQHAAYTWNHVHAVSGTTTPYQAFRVFLYFIQYKG